MQICIQRKITAIPNHRLHVSFPNSVYTAKTVQNKAKLLICGSGPTAAAYLQMGARIDHAKCKLFFEHFIRDHSLEL